MTISATNWIEEDLNDSKNQSENLLKEALGEEGDNQMEDLAENTESVGNNVVALNMDKDGISTDNNLIDSNVDKPYYEYTGNNDESVATSDKMPIDLEDKEVEAVAVLSIAGAIFKDSGLKEFCSEIMESPEELEVLIDEQAVGRNLEDAFKEYKLPSMPFELAGVAKVVNTLEGYHIVSVGDQKIAMPLNAESHIGNYNPINKQINLQLSRGLIADVSLMEIYTKNGLDYPYLTVSIKGLQGLFARYKKYGVRVYEVVEDEAVTDYRLKVGV